jgi:hypothetical protein
VVEEDGGTCCRVGACVPDVRGVYGLGLGFVSIRFLCSSLKVY